MMAYSEKLADKIRRALAHLPDVEEKKMFGGLAFMVNGKMCLAADADKIMCRIDPGIHEEAIKKEGCETVIMKGREYKGWVYVNEKSLQAEEAFHQWIGFALDFNKKVQGT